jgi:glycosyltransferase involved in cell wall biosynthesis
MSGFPGGEGRNPVKEKILVVIPAYNEERTIGDVVAKAKESVPMADVLVIDDHRCYDYVVQMDGDGQHEPRCINDLLAEVRSGAADIALGSRFLRDRSYKALFIRRLGMMLFGFLTSLAIRQRITDPTSGFQALSRQVVEFHTSDGYPIDFPDADVLISLSLNGFRIKEVPVIMYQKAGKSMHSGLKPFYYVFKMLLSIFLTFFRKRG